MEGVPASRVSLDFVGFVNSSGTYLMLANAYRCKYFSLGNVLLEFFFFKISLKSFIKRVGL